MISRCPRTAGERYGTGNLQQWYVVAAGNRLAVMHGKRIYALPAV